MSFQDEIVGAAQGFMFDSALGLQASYLLQSAAGFDPTACIVSGDDTARWRARHG